jgi:hypothetical protein
MSVLVFWVVILCGLVCRYRSILWRNAMERRSRSSFSKGYKPKRRSWTFLSSIGITNTTLLRPNFGLLLTFRNIFQKKIILCKYKNILSPSPRLIKAVKVEVVSSFKTLLFMSMEWDYVSELRPLMGLLFIPQTIYEWRARVEWHWQDKTEQLGETFVPVPLCPSQISQGSNRARTRDSAVTGRRLTAQVYNIMQRHVIISRKYI